MAAQEFRFNALTGGFDLIELPTIEEIDGTPSGTLRTLKVTNGTLTDGGSGVFTLTIAAGGAGSEPTVSDWWGW